MPKKLVFLFLLSTVLLTACNPVSDVALDRSSTQWRFESYRCAFGCDPLLEESLNQQLGEVLDFDKPDSGFALFPQCTGKRSLATSMQNITTVLEELNQTIPPDQQFTIENTGLPQPMVVTAQGLCVDSESSSSNFRVVSLTQNEMLVYFEGASFLKFRATN